MLARNSINPELKVPNFLKSRFEKSPTVKNCAIFSTSFSVTDRGAETKSEIDRYFALQLSKSGFEVILLCLRCDTMSVNSFVRCDNWIAE